ncbi:MAG: hypothetical protein LBK52_02165 [Deltaproteobacteria bacterium]|nr:hypothetical protein [Deltaproteobacteria bacterium]
MEYDDPMEEVRRIREELLEMYGGSEGLRKHLAEQRPRWIKEGKKLVTAEEVAALKNSQDND